MAKFCTQCGRPLQEGEVCNCQQKIVSPGSVPKAESTGTEDVKREEAVSNMSGQGQPEANGVNQQNQPGANGMNQPGQSGTNGMNQQGQPGAGSVNQQEQPGMGGMNQSRQGGPNGANPQYRQGGPNGTNPQYRQGGPNGTNPQYRQGGPNGANPQYRQAGPGMNQQYRQGGSNGANQQYRQGGPNGANPQYRQGGPNGANQQYRQGGPNGANQQYRQQGPGMNQQYRQPQGAPINVNEIGNKAKNIFGDMLESIKKPVAYSRVLTRRAYSKAGMEMIIFKGIVSLIVTLLCGFSLSMMVRSVVRSTVGDWSSLIESTGYNYDISLPWFQLILLVAVLTFGADFLEALWLKLLTRTNKSYMVMTVNVGVRCAYDTLAIVLCGLFFILACLAKSPTLLVPIAIVLIVYAVSMQYIQFACYNAVLNDDPDSKVRRYILVKVLQSISMGIITGIFGMMVVEDVVKMISCVF